MRKRDTSPLTSGPDRPAGPTRTTALQKILHCELCAGLSKTAALSAPAKKGYVPEKFHAPTPPAKDSLKTTTAQLA
jgi:hypothetical protein